MIDTSKLTPKQKQIYELYKDDEDFDMAKALAQFAPKKAAVRQVARVREPKEAPSRELRLFIEFLHRRVEMVQKQCRECLRVFACDYLYMSFCSDACRAAHLFRNTGLVWDDTKPERERWNGEPPSIIKPDTLAVLINFAHRILNLPTVKDYGGFPDPAYVEEDYGPTPYVGRESPPPDVETVKAVKSSDTVAELKTKLNSGEISATEYQLALADLF